MKNLRIVSLPGDINERRMPLYLDVSRSPAYRVRRAFLLGLYLGAFAALTIAGYVAGLLP